MINKYVGQKIREFRKEKKMNQSELGKILGVAQNTVTGYEKGEIEVGYDNLFKLAETFDKKVDDFFPPTKNDTHDILQRAIGLSNLDDLSIDELNFIKKLAEKALSLDKKERARFMESIKFTVEYYEKMKD